MGIITSDRSLLDAFSHLSSNQMMVDMTAEHPVNETVAIHRYHLIYTIPAQALSDPVHPSAEREQSE